MIERLGPYRIDKLLGRGGMGTVYAGTHEETGERAAIKALSLTLADDGNFRERFAAEIETLKQIEHPNIVRLYGEGEQDGQLFYVMELVDGKTLQEELQQGHRFGWREVTRIGIEVCQALKHAHDRGIIHRELKPANLLRDEEGHIKLTDFGIAKLFGATHLTADGSVVGTADYMAPEQSDGSPISYRTDLYSLGNVMFTLLCKRPPFTGKSIPELLHKLRYEDPPLVRRFAHDVPRELEEIISQLLEKDPDDRIPTALALANRLKAMQHGLMAETVVDPDADVEQHAARSDDKRATRVSKTQDSPATEVAPTSIDSGFTPKMRDDYAWNEATVVTAESEAQKLNPEQRKSITVVDEAGNANRFTTVEAQRQHAAQKAEANRHEYLKAAALAAGLIALVGGIIWGLQPPSADQLYRRIATTVQQADIRDAKSDIDEFHERFPNDPRFDEVHGWLLDIQCQYLFNRLRIRAKKQKLSDVQAAYVEAMQLVEQQPASATRRFDALIESFQEAKDEANPITCVEAARHQLARLKMRLPAKAVKQDSPPNR